VDDEFALYHPNIQSVRSTVNVVKYVTKENKWISNFDVEATVEAKKMKRKIIAKKLLTGTDLKDVVEENPEYLYGYKKLK